MDRMGRPWKMTSKLHLYLAKLIQLCKFKNKIKLKNTHTHTHTKERWLRTNQVERSNKGKV